MDYGSRSLLLLCGVPATFARAASYIVGSSVAYWLNSKLTFSGERSRAEVARAMVSYVVCFGIAVLVDAVMRRLFPDVDHIFTISWVVSQGCATVANFILQSTWVFQNKGDKPIPPV